MYEQFTDRARKVMQLANQEAQRFNHEYIGTEHVLLGLIKEPSGVAGRVLESLKADLGKVRIEVEKLVTPGPEMVTMGKLPLTPRTKKVINYATDEARGLGHNYVGTEHLLLGLVREEEGIAAQVLATLGIDAEVVRKEVAAFIGTAKGASEEAKQVAERITAAFCVRRKSAELARLAEMAALRLEQYGGDLNVSLAKELRAAAITGSAAWTVEINDISNPPGT